VEEIPPREQSHLDVLFEAFLCLFFAISRYKSSVIEKSLVATH
jgi:hypothetical protein